MKEITEKKLQQQVDWLFEILVIETGRFIKVSIIENYLEQGQEMGLIISAHIAALSHCMRMLSDSNKAVEKFICDLEEHIKLSLKELDLRLNDPTWAH
jgi:hypothetical protein